MEEQFWLRSKQIAGSSLITEGAYHVLDHEGWILTPVEVSETSVERPRFHEFRWHPLSLFGIDGLDELLTCHWLTRGEPGCSEVMSTVKPLLEGMVLAALAFEDTKLYSAELETALLPVRECADGLIKTVRRFQTLVHAASLGLELPSAGVPKEALQAGRNEPPSQLILLFGRYGFWAEKNLIPFVNVSYLMEDPRPSNMTAKLDFITRRTFWVEVLLPVLTSYNVVQLINLLNSSTDPVELKRASASLMWHYLLWQRRYAVFLVGDQKRQEINEIWLRAALAIDTASSLVNNPSMCLAL